MNRYAAYAVAVAAVVLAPSASWAGKTFTATVIFQNGLNGYADASDSSLRPGTIKLVDDVKRPFSAWHESQVRQGKAKREDILEAQGNYRHLLKWDHLDRVIHGRHVKVLSAKMEIFYVDEFWSFADYQLRLYRSLDGTKDNVEAGPAAASHILGSRRGKEATPFGSWIEFNVRSDVVQAWLDDPGKNFGLVLANPSHDEPLGRKSTGFFLVFSSNTDGTAALRPKLTITYEAEGNVPPFTPVLSSRFDGVVVGAAHVVRWSMPEKPDLNGDPIHFEAQWAPADAEAWTPIARDMPGDARQWAWRTADVPEGKRLKLRLRAVDAEGVASDWARSDGAFIVAHRDVPFQVGVVSPLAKFRREEPYRGPLGGELKIELARNEYEGAQFVLNNVNREIENLRVSAGPLRFAGPGDRTTADIPAANVDVRFVGYVHTVHCDKYHAEWVGLWPDPLLNVPNVTLTPGKVQPVQVSVYAPRGTQAGSYTGTLTITGDGIDPQTLPLAIRVFDFDLPVRGTLRTMAIAGGPDPKFYGLEPGPELDALRERWYAFLGQHRLPPGGYALKSWGWLKPGYPAKAKADGSWDFSEAERWGRFCFDRGMTTFVAAGFAKLGKFGFPKEYSPRYRADYNKFMTAYADFLRAKGWLKDAVVYNIDEAPQSMWQACKENYLATKAVSPDLSVFQCLNDPKGVAALEGSFDVVDVNLGQYHQGAAPVHLAKGGRTWWAICCWPSSHPNLFIEYPGIDARIVGWLSWKAGIEGFEYWNVSSWANCLKAMGDKPWLDQIESPWMANAFGNYNGDGYLCYPGPNRTILSSLRFEALRDGFEDYEYLSVLKRKLEGQPGGQLDAVRKLLDVPDTICASDLSFTSDTTALFAFRRTVAEAIEHLNAR